MTIDLTAPQDAFIYCEDKHPAIVGGLGSGKSKAGTLRLIRLLLADPGANGAYYMPVYDLLTLRAIPGIEEDLEQLGLEYRTNKSSYTIDIIGYGAIIFRSYDRPERIIAYEVAHSICDELDTLPKDKAALVWRKISERNRQNREHKNTLGLVTTPDQGVNGFVYEKWVKKQQDGYTLFKASTYSNPFLPEDYADQILANYDPILAQLYLEGEFVSLNQNKVYHFFDRTKHHVARSLTVNDSVIHIGLDFNIGGCCAVTFVIENNSPIAVDEFVSHDTQDFINNLTRYAGKTCVIYPDASGKANKTNSSQSDISMIAQAGYQLQYKPSNPAVRDRINAYNGLLSHDRLLINTDTCPNLTNALETQGYDDKGDPEKFNAHPAIDDWCFSGDTKIIVNGLEICFRDIPETGLIKGAKGNNILFYNGGYKGLEKLLAIKLNDGKIIHATKEHEFLTLSGWVKAENLAGESLCNTEYYLKKCRSLTVKNIIKELMDIFIKHLEALNQSEKEHQESPYTEQHGRIFTEKLRKVLSCIIKMKISLITIFQIWRLCRKASITRFILSSGINNTQNTQEKPLKKLKTNAGSGTLQKLAKNGINKIMKTIKHCFTKKPLENVRYAQKNMSEETQEQINTAQKTAKHKREEIAELITKKEIALSAIPYLKQINTQQKNVAVVSVRELATKEAVYCLSTNEGCFSLANGLIVSNCDSSGYFIAYKYPVIRSMQTAQILGL